MNQLYYPVEIKSTGVLIDEWITAQFKVQAGIAGAQERQDELDAALKRRGVSIEGKLLPLYSKLRKTSRACWNAQEHINRDGICVEVMDMAVVAQETNRQRNELIRQIDQLLGEHAPLEKTYGG